MEEKEIDEVNSFLSLSETFKFVYICSNMISNELERTQKTSREMSSSLIVQLEKELRAKKAKMKRIRWRRRNEKSRKS